MKFLFSSNLKYGIPEARKTKKPTVFLGGSCYDNNWREYLKEKLSDKIFFLDPYDEDWRPEDNIYEELAGMTVADYVVFYKGADDSEKEKEFLNYIGYGFKEFDSLRDLEEYLKKLTKPEKTLSERIRKLASLLQ